MKLAALIPRRRGLSKAQLQQRAALNQLQRFEAVLNRHRRSLKDCTTILEFGCGHGRLLKPVADFVPGASIAGCDVLNKAVAVCRRKFPQGRFVTNGALPPLAFADGSFDLMYSYSVFTHLPEAHHRAWLKELARVLRPGGVMLHTIHSHEFLRRASRFSPESLVKYALPQPVDALIRSGTGYTYTMDDPTQPAYGLAIISPAYVAAHWPKVSGLTLLDHVEGAIEAYPEGCQDIVLLLKAPQ
ncbi:MAG: class I SAM-dependent methyltransferase [Candidatus Omnitrophica bacterium]|nr:class I SAM-dependent methyltransferase [Candidatus Omnitrophota bacterium]